MSLDTRRTGVRAKRDHIPPDRGRTNHHDAAIEWGDVRFGGTSSSGVSTPRPRRRSSSQSSRGGRGVDKPNGRRSEDAISAEAGVVRTSTTRQLNGAKFDLNTTTRRRAERLRGNRVGGVVSAESHRPDRRAGLPTLAHRAFCLPGTVAVDKAWITPSTPCH